MKKKRNIVYYDKEVDLDLSSMDHLDDQDTEIGPTPDIDFSGPSLDPQDRFEPTPKPGPMVRSTPAVTLKPEPSGRPVPGGTINKTMAPPQARTERFSTSQMAARPNPSEGSKPSPGPATQVNRDSAGGSSPKTISEPGSAARPAKVPQPTPAPKRDTEAPSSAGKNPVLPPARTVEELKKDGLGSTESLALEERVARLEVQMDRVIQLLEHIATIYK